MITRRQFLKWCVGAIATISGISLFPACLVNIIRLTM